MEILITGLIILLIFSVAWYALDKLKPPEPIRTIAIVIGAIVLIVLLVRLIPGVHLGI